jgi:Aerotolerance regulator N-terminal/von Willebrand factor type A domain
MSLSFLVPAFLGGLLALGIPILIHLSRRHTDEPVQFPSLMFLRRIPQETQSRRRIHRWPLFLLRCLAIALLVFAFSRPFVERSGASVSMPGTGNREVIVLVDRSYSMGVGDRWDRAVAAANDAINGLTGGDRGTVILFDANAESATESTVDRNVLRGAVENAEPGVRTTRYAPALRYAGRILSSSPLPRHELVVISDFQQSGWDSDGGETGTIRLPPGTVITPVVVGDTNAIANASIVGADFARETVAERERIDVTGRLTGSGAMDTTVQVTLEVDGRVVETREARFEGGSASVTFNPLTLPTAGSTRATLRVPADALATDNAFNFVLSSDQRVGVLIVDGPGATPEASFFLERALTIGDTPGFRPEIRRSGQLRAVDLATNAVVILNQMGMPSGEIGDRLREYVEQGGGLIMLLGDNAIGNWPGVLPGVPGAVDRDSQGGIAIGYIDTGHPIFESFAGPRTGDFGAARVYRYRPLPSGAFPRVLARFGDGGAALAERPVGEGRVLVWTSTLDGSWNDLTLQPVFLPFLHQLVKYSAGYTPPRSWLTVGDPFDLTTGLPAGEEYTMALTPAGERLTLDPGQPLRLDEIGFYELRNPQVPGQALNFAVNIDPAEAELTTFDPEEMRSALLAASTAEVQSTSEEGLSLAERERQQSGWWYLVVAAFLLLAGETLFSNRRSKSKPAWWRRFGGRGSEDSNNNPGYAA